ncbi:MAG: hypothetical protein APF84_05025 [Gracilibacter sp. BRH_c7a]|nr:MAG: hypothetical protein APF84_05025 [Gracilibacter sp. BRH_c7a]
MSVFSLFILICGIIGGWIIAGRYEYQIPISLSNRIVSWKLLERNREALDALVVNIEAREFITENMEKEIYIVRKSRKPRDEHMLMNVGIQIEQNPPDNEEIEKAKQRLEKRFPGLTVNFSSQGQEDNNAVLCSD